MDNSSDSSSDSSGDEMKCILPYGQYLILLDKDKKKSKATKTTAAAAAKPKSMLGMGGVLERYLSTKSAAGDKGSAESSKASPEMEQLSLGDTTVEPLEKLGYDQSTPVADLLKSLAAERQFTEEQLKSDIQFFVEQNRFRTVGDLLLLSKSGWKDLYKNGSGCVPLVKDLVKAKIDLLRDFTKKQKHGKEKDSKSVAGSSDYNSKLQQLEKIENDIIEATGTPMLNHKPLPIISPSIKLGSSADRLVVEVANGIKFECDRWCPHKGVDLAGGSVLVQGSSVKLVCPKHKWEFELNNGGIYPPKGKTVNACKLDW